ncbi:MAG TPA: hypothetical protein VIU81_12095 [Gaiellaceae bacterium]
MAVTALVQAVIFVLSGSVALLADLIHNVGDALTAVPLGDHLGLLAHGHDHGAGRARRARARTS